MDNIFEFKIINIHWMDNSDYRRDLCPHGKVFVKIDNEILSDNNSQDWTLSATGLYLLRSLKNDYELFMYKNYLLPCCGFDFWLNENNNVSFMGCNSGIDFKIKHKENKMVKIISENNSNVIITENDFSNIVYDFITEVEMYYDNNKKRKVHKDNKMGYKIFWEEWKKLKNDYYK